MRWQRREEVYDCEELKPKPKEESASWEASHGVVRGHKSAYLLEPGAEAEL